MRSFTSQLAIFLIAALFLGSCSVGRSPITGNKRAYAYSWEEELQIGKEADEQIQVQYGLYDDPGLTAYVDRIGQSLLEHSHLRRPEAEQQFKDTKFTFRVLDSPIVNAFALPGGYVYVTRGLLAHMENEAQLAVVLGHEIGHVAGRHASKRALGGLFSQIALIGGAVAGEVFWGAGEEILEVGGVATELMLLKYGRDDESESDRLGVEYAALDGYQAAEGAAFFGTLKRLSDKAGAEIPSFLSTHPEPGSREEDIKQRAARWEEQGLSMTRVDQAALYKEIDGIVVGEDPRQGYVENDVFYHPELRFSFPTPGGWQTVNQPIQFVMVENDQNAVMVLTLVQDANSLQEASNEFAGENGITIRSNTATQVNGLQARAVLARAAGENSESFDILAYYISYNNTIYRILGYTATNAFSRYRSTFERTMTGFKQLTDPSKINVQPDRLQIIQTQNVGTFQSFVPNSLPQSLTPEDLAILNQVQLSDSVPRGTSLKLVQ